MVFDPDDFKHIPRVEDYRGRKVGRDVVYSPRGDYVTDSRVLSFNDSEMFEIRFQAETDNIDFMSENRRVDVQYVVGPGLGENVLGSLPVDDFDFKVATRTMYLEEEGYDIRVEDLEHSLSSADTDTDVSIMELHGSGSREDLAGVAAGYANEIANVPEYSEENASPYVKLDDRSDREKWEQLFLNSLGSAKINREESLKHKN